MRCSTLLINKGTTTTINDTGELVTVIEWGLSHHGHAGTSELSFMCGLDNRSPLEECKQNF